MTTSATATHYETLGVPRDASASQIKAAWRTVRRRTHPDTGGSDELFAAASEAYEVLSDPNARLMYDLSLDSPTNQGSANDDPDVTDPVSVAEDWGAPINAGYPGPAGAPSPTPGTAGPFPAPPRPARPAPAPRAPSVPFGVRVKAGLKTAIWRWTIAASVVTFFGFVAWIGDITIGGDASTNHWYNAASSLPFMLAMPWAATSFGNLKWSIPGRVWAYGALYLGASAAARHHYLTVYWVLIAALSMMAAEMFSAASRARGRRARVRRWDQMQEALAIYRGSVLAWCKDGVNLGSGRQAVGHFAFGGAPAVPIYVRTFIPAKRWVAIEPQYGLVRFWCGDKDRREWNKAHGYK